MAITLPRIPSVPYKYRGWLCVFGGFLVHLSLGTIYTFGNMSPYVTSYIRAYSSPSTLHYDVSTWIFALGAAAQGASMWLGGMINAKIGPRWTALLGGWIMSAGVLLTAITIKHSFYLCIFTYGFVFGFGVGIAYAAPLACAMKWLPNHKGLVNGIVVAGYGGGAFIFDEVQTAYINPDNVSPNYPPDAKEQYFPPDDVSGVLSRTPTCFIIIGVCYAVMQFIGSMMLTDPPRDAEIMSLVVQEIDEEDAPQTAVETDSQPGSELGELHPKDVLRTRAFYTLWATFFVNGQSVFFVSTLYKAYGQTFIHDDKFLATLGSFASIGNAGGRIMWGFLMDRYSYRMTMLCICSSMMVFMMTLLATPHGGKAMFFIWVFALFLIFSGNFALFPTVTAKTFGQKYVAINFGLVFTSQTVTAIVGAVLTSTLSDAFGYTGMFFLIAAFAFIGVLLTISFNVKTPEGEEV